MLSTLLSPRRPLSRAFFAALFLVASFLLPAQRALAQVTIHVPTDQPTIQAGINAAKNGDTVLVAPGTYYENIDFGGKALTVTSSGGAASTIIDGGNKATAVYLGSASGTATLQGFTVQHGYPEQSHPGYSQSYNYGGGIVVVGNALVFANTVQNNTSCGIDVVGGTTVYVSGNHILDNIPAPTAGADCRVNAYGVLVHDLYAPYPTNAVISVQNNTIESNFDGGVDFYNLSGSFVASVDYNIIRSNGLPGSIDGGIGVGAYSVGAFISGNLIVGNRSVGIDGGAIIDSNTIQGNNTAPSASYLVSSASEVIVNSATILYNNIIVGSSSKLPTVYCADPITTYQLPCVWDHNLIYNTATASGSINGIASPGVGNLFVDPMFKAPGSDFHLQAVLLRLMRATTVLS